MLFLRVTGMVDQRKGMEYILTGWLQEHCFILITKAFRGETGWQNWWLTRNLAWINKHFLVKQCLGVSRRSQMVLSLSEWIAAVPHAKGLISYWLVGAESNHLRLMLFSYRVKLGMTQFLLNEEKMRDTALQLSQVTGILFTGVSCALKQWTEKLQDREMCLALIPQSMQLDPGWLSPSSSFRTSAYPPRRNPPLNIPVTGLDPVLSPVSWRYCERLWILWLGPLKIRIHVLSLQKQGGNEYFLSQVSFTPARTLTALCVRGTENCLKTFICNWKISC